MHLTRKDLAWIVRQKRKALRLTQVQLAIRTHVGLRFIRDLEQGKSSLRMDKVNKVLEYFGMELIPSDQDRK
jgi:y4mF family transcriptional regulator